MKKNDINKLKITGMTSEGNGVGRTEENMAVFVPFTAIGDIISCKIVKINKSYAFGIIDEMIEASKTRICNDCEVFGKCGGCSFRHISYSDELSIKQNLVSDAFKRIGGFSEINIATIEGSPSENAYRNKAQYPVALQDGKAVCGFYSKRSHRVIPYTDCKLQPKVFSEIVTYCLELFNKNGIAPYDEKTRRGFLRHIYIRQGFHSKEIMLCFVGASSNTKKMLEIVPKIAEKFSDIKSIVLNVNAENTNVILGKKNIFLYGSEHIFDTICGNKVKLSPHSFYQINTPAAENIYRYAKELAGLTGTETVLDLYCGAGTIGLSFADKAKKIIGCEIVKEAVADAIFNAENNGYKNAEFYAMDASEFAKKLVAEKVQADVIVVDPPRKGCDEVALDSIVKISPKKLVMISCNPSTAARDAKFLCENGYELVLLKPFDLFPRTGHVECIIMMQRAKNEVE